LVGVLALGFLLLLSLLVTTVLAAGAAYITPFLSEAALHAISFLLSFAMVGLLFAMMFKWLPDTDIAWGDVWLGAIVTAALFEIGKLLISLYIGKLALQSTYGAAASIVVVLLWVYYNAQILLAGAEFTRVYAESHGSKKPVIKPEAGRRPRGECGRLMRRPRPSRASDRGPFGRSQHRSHRSDRGDRTSRHEDAHPVFSLILLWRRRKRKLRKVAQFS
jgi:membrane protein